VDAVARCTDWLRQKRDGCLSSPRFRQLAMAFPVTRPVARRRARAVFDLCAGFVYTQVLFACVKLRVFEHLAGGPRSLDSLAGSLALPLDSTRRLLEGAVALHLVERRSDDRFGLGALGATLVRNPAVTALIEHHELLYADLADPVALLRNPGGETALSCYWAYARRRDPLDLEAAQVADFTTLMSVSQALIADEVLARYRFDRHRCLLDIGGGDGAFLIAVSSRARHLQLMLFDLPSVAERAAARFGTVGLDARSRTFGGDFFADSLPGGADVASIVRVLHDHDDDRALALLRAAHRALLPGGTLLVVEPMAETKGAEPMGDTYFGFYLLAMGQGRPRSSAALTQMLRTAGFDTVKRIATRTPLQTGLLIARRT